MEMSPYMEWLNLEKLLKKEIQHMIIMLECNLKLLSRVLLFPNARKRTRKSTHDTRLGGVAQGLHIAIVLGVCGLELTSKHITVFFRKVFRGGKPMFREIEVGAKRQKL